VFKVCLLITLFLVVVTLSEIKQKNLYSNTLEEVSFQATTQMGQHHLYFVISGDHWVVPKMQENK
jgi:hypothetical protein